MNKVAIIQMCSLAKVENNLAKVSDLIKKASTSGARMVLLPEMFPIFGLTPHQKVNIAESYGVGQIQDFIRTQARHFKVWIIAGTIPIKSDDPNKIKAASLVFDERGEVRARYDKVHLFDVSLSKSETYRESDTVDPGNEIVVVKSPFGCIGLAVCYDIRFPEMFRAMLKKGVEIFCIPSAFTYTTGNLHWEVLCRARAIENQCYVLAACQGGIHENGRRTFGNSMIVHPSGKVLKRLDDSSVDVALSSINLLEVQSVRRSIPCKPDNQYVK